MISSIDFPFVINAVSSDCPLHQQTEANPKREKDTGDATKAIVINNCPPNISFFFFKKRRFEFVNNRAECADCEVIFDVSCELMMKWVKMEDQNAEDYDSNTRNISATGSKDFFFKG